MSCQAAEVGFLVTETTKHNPKIYACSLWTYNHKKRCYIQPRQPEPSREHLGANYASLWRCRGGNTHPCTRFWAPLLLQPAPFSPAKDAGKLSFHLPGKPCCRRSDPGCRSYLRSRRRRRLLPRFRTWACEDTAAEKRSRAAHTVWDPDANGRAVDSAPGKAPLLSCSPDGRTAAPIVPCQRRLWGGGSWPPTRLEDGFSWSWEDFRGPLSGMETLLISRSARNADAAVDPAGWANLAGCLLRCPSPRRSRIPIPAETISMPTYPYRVWDLTNISIECSRSFDVNNLTVLFGRKPEMHFKWMHGSECVLSPITRK